MNDDALRKLWQEQTFTAPPGLPDTEQIAVVKRKMKRFDKTLFWRDCREVAACLLVVGWFGSELFRNHSLEAQLGCWLLILSGIFIAAKLILSRRRVPPAEPSASLEEATGAEIRKVDVQIDLLRSVWWWYLLPLML